jgi:hypothetical protein
MFQPNRPKIWYYMLTSFDFKVGGGEDKDSKFICDTTIVLFVWKHFGGGFTCPLSTVPNINTYSQNVQNRHYQQPHLLLIRKFTPQI